LLPLYCKIYREKGYWIDWYDEDSKMLFAQDECKLETSVVDEVVNGCIRRSLFDKGVFDMFGVLTSDRIQENYVIAKWRASNVILYEEFLLIDEKVYQNHKSVTVIPITATVITKKVTVKPQKKKEKEISEEERDSGVHTEEQKTNYKNFVSFIKDKAPTVAKMKEPFTIDEFLKLKKKFTSEQIREMVLKMHNYKPLLSKNNSAYLTFLNWSSKDDWSKQDAAKLNANSVNNKLKSVG